MVNNLRKKDNYYKQKSLISPTINSFLKKNKGILYGSTAVNFYTPPHLDAVPGDYDVYSQSPKKSARKVERKLDKKFGGDYFKVEKAKYPRTWKVRSNVTKKAIIDFTKPETKIPHNITKSGIRYAKLSYLKKKYKAILKDKEEEYRWDKTKEALQRIRIYEKLYK